MFYQKPTLPGNLLPYLFPLTYKNSLAIFIIIFSAMQLQGQAVFQKFYTDYNSQSFYTYKHIRMADSGFVLLMPVKKDTTHLVLKLNKYGNTVWSKKLYAEAGSLKMDIRHITEMPDGGLILGGSLPQQNDAYKTDFLLIKLNKNGKPEWTKTIDRDEMDDYISDITVSGNIIFILGSSNFKNELLYHNVLMRLDFQGKVISTSVHANARIDGFSKIVVKDGWAYMSGQTRRKSHSGDPALMIADPSGKFTDFYCFSFIGGKGYVNIIRSGDNIYLAGEKHLNSNTSQFIIKFRPSLNPEYEFYEIDQKYWVGNAGMGADAAGNIYLAGELDTADRWNQVSRQNAFICKLNPEMGIAWTKIYGSTGIVGFYSLNVRGDGNISANGAGSKPLLLSTDHNGNTGCKNDYFKLNIRKSSAELSSFLPDFAPSIQPTVKNIAILAEDYYFKENIACQPDPPIAGFTFSDTNICSGQCISFTDTSKNAVNWEWKFENSNTGSSTSQQPQNICFNKAGKHKITQIVSNITGTDTLEKFINVNALPEADAGNDTTICQGEKAQLKATGGIAYTWISAADISDTNVASPLVWPQHSKTYFVEVKNEAGCVSKDSVKVRVIEPIYLKNSGYDSTICLQKSLILDAGLSGYNYLWNTGEKSQNIVVKEAGKYEVNISNKCFTEKLTFNINTRDCSTSFFIPDAFVPEAGALNNKFDIVGENIADIEMKIFNRWGEKIFEDKSKNPAWDGLWKGNKLPEGLYFYIVNVKGEDGSKTTKSGTIFLIR